MVVSRVVGNDAGDGEGENDCPADGGDDVEGDEVHEREYYVMLTKV